MQPLLQWKSEQQIYTKFIHKINLDVVSRPKCLLQSCMQSALEITWKGKKSQYNNLIVKLLLENSLVIQWPHHTNSCLLHVYVIFFQARILQWVNPMSKIFSASYYQTVFQQLILNWFRTEGLNHKITNIIIIIHKNKLIAQIKQRVFTFNLTVEMPLWKEVMVLYFSSSQRSRILLT